MKQFSYQPQQSEANAWLDRAARLGGVMNIVPVTTKPVLYTASHKPDHHSGGLGFLTHNDSLGLSLDPF
jgi:hypothetical protein